MINLLPQSRQNAIKQEEASKIAAIIGIIIAAAFLVFVLMLVLIKIFYQYRLRAAEIMLAEKETMMQIQDVALIENKIAANNILISKIDNSYGSRPKITVIFSQMAECLPAQIFLSRFNFGPNRANLEGFAPNRDILALFKNNLERRTDFADVFFPASNWLASRDIEFNVSFEYVGH